MALIKCKECGKEISDTVKICPHCGYNEEQENKNNNKKVVIIVSIIITIITFIIISIFICNQLKWKDFETCETDKFEIKYSKDWNVENDTSTGLYGKIFKDENNTIQFYLSDKSELGNNVNSAKKMKDNTLNDMNEENIKKLTKNSYVDFQVKKLDTNEITVNRLKGYKIDFEITANVLNGYEIDLEILKEIGTKGSVVFIEDDTYIYCMSLEGEDLETFNKMIESIKIK